MKLFENVAREENNEEVIKESYVIEVEIDHTKFLEYQVCPISESYECLEESVSGKITVKDKQNDITIWYRDRDSGGYEGKQMQHSVSVKIISPAKYKDTSIEIKKDPNEPLKINSKTVKRASDIPVLYEFLNDPQNRRYFFSIYESKRDETKERAVNQIVNHNKDIIKDITFNQDDTDHAKEFENKLRSKLNNDN